MISKGNIIINLKIDRYDKKLVLKYIENQKISKEKERGRGSNNGIYL